MTRSLPRLHVVTDDAVLAGPDFQAGARAVLESGGADVALHLRGPGTPGGPLHALALALVPVAGAAGATVVVNDRVDVALLAGAHGVQVGRRSLPAPRARSLLPPGCRVGVSAHAPEEVEAAARDGADWAFMGTIYPTPSHPDRSGAGPAGIRRSVEAAASLPVIAIGGITPGRVRAVMEAGARGVAVVRGVWEEPDPAEAVGRYLSALEEETR